MLFMALIIYSALMPGTYLASVSLFPLPKGLFLLIVMPVTFAISMLLSLFIAYLIDVYNPRAKDSIRDLLCILGLRWICALTSLAIMVCLLVDFVVFQVIPSTLALSYLMPIMAVSALNAMNIEFALKRLSRAPLPRKVVVPESSVEPPIKKEIVKDFHWTFNNKIYDAKLVIRRRVYDSLKSKPRNLDHLKWSEEYVTNGISGEIRQLSKELMRKDVSYGRAEVEFILAFVQQSISYQTEESEYPRYPVESLADGVGDCKDYSILGAALLKSMGYDVALLYLPGHSALGVCGAESMPGFYAKHGEKRYYYCEMTNSGWSLGEIPEKYKESDIIVTPVPDLKVKIVLPDEATNIA